MPQRINKAVELLAQKQPIYYVGSEERGYDAGRAAARTWADYIAYEMEHGPYDITALHAFMHGLADGGPTASGHRTPAVIPTLPVLGRDEASFKAGAWMVWQALAAGVHGILLCHAESPGAVAAFVESTRYPFASKEGRRGSGGQASAAAVWGLSTQDYLAKADPWPLNPDGELLLGLKIENKRALENCEKTLAVPGIAFAEWGPGDMGMSLGFPDAHDPPYPPEMQAARARVLAACQANGVAFLEMVNPDNVIAQIAAGVLVGAGRQAQAAAEIGRKHTGRTMPW
ncbi:MAG TPA: aldolase/citrate lyase family protein [Chloroflexota bacterium]